MTLLAIGGLLVALQAGSAAADPAKTIVGDAACGKCVLKEGKNCQLTITADEAGKKVTYYVVANNATKEFGQTLCAGQKKVKATGAVNVADGKQMLVATKIELAKD